MNRSLTGLVTALIMLITPPLFSEDAASRRAYTNLNKYKSLMASLEEGEPLPEKTFKIEHTGPPGMVRFEDFGEMTGLGTPDYQFHLTDPQGLSRVMGAGMAPNPQSITEESAYAVFQKKGLLDVDNWEAYEKSDDQTAFYVWTHSPEPSGVNAFFTGKILERAGYIRQALKAYYACLVLYPRSAAWGKDGTFVWYIAPAALANIQRLCLKYSSLNLSLEGAFVEVRNGGDINFDNDVISVNPGHFVETDLSARLAQYPELKESDIRRQRGGGEVQLVQYANGHWQLMVDNEPYLIKGIFYQPTKIGMGPFTDSDFSSRWMFEDSNNNGLIDAPYESWVDSNADGVKNPNEPAVGDFALLRRMGVNTIRLYIDLSDGGYRPDRINKQLLRDLYQTYGIRVVVGNFLGAYLQGSGASWTEGTDYTNPEQRQKMAKTVRDMVEDLKDEPFVLMWLLGNENNMPIGYYGVNATRTNAPVYPKQYAEFLNKMADMIHKIDGDHPVAVGNIELGLIEYYDRYAPQIDVLGVNSYRGKDGFDSLWVDARRGFDRPVLITEYGHDAYDPHVPDVEEAQMEYHRNCIKDIIMNQAGGPLAGNAIGGMVYEFVDEWWKNTQGDPENVHSVNSNVMLPFSDGVSHEEWLGITSQGSGKNSPFERRLRKAYDLYQDIFNR